MSSLPDFRISTDRAQRISCGRKEIGLPRREVANRKTGRISPPAEFGRFDTLRLSPV